MLSLLLACSLVCAQLTLVSSRLVASDSSLAETYATQDHVPPVVGQDTEPRGLLSLFDDITVVSGDDYLGSKPQAPTKYPIVLLHGFLGWDQVFFLDYFYHIRRELEADGFTVYAPQINPVSSVEVRGKELGPLLEKILAETGAEKVNIIAHSMGGLDARYLIGHGYDKRIASLTTIGTPHHGTPVPDLIFGVLGQNNPLFKAFEFISAGLVGNGHFKPSDLNLRECLWNLSKKYMEEYFNLYFTDSPDIYYQSFAGITSATGLRTGDIIDPLLVPFMPAFKLGDRSDGLVVIDSAKWGRFRGLVSADHVNLIGQLFGRTASRFDHLMFYRKLAWELADMGY